MSLVLGVFLTLSHGASNSIDDHQLLCQQLSKDKEEELEIFSLFPLQQILVDTFLMSLC